jgi:hypothetical protein
MEGAVLTIHFISSFVISTLAVGWPFRFEKAVAHKAPLSHSEVGNHPRRFVLIPNPQSKTVFCTDASNGAKCGRKSHLSFPERINASVEVRDELAVLNAYRRFKVQTPHDRREIQIMYLAKLARTQAMVAVVAGPMVPGAKGHGG